MVQVLAIALAALRLLTRLFEASKALLELVRSSLEGHDDGRREKARARPRHQKNRAAGTAIPAALAKMALPS